jgi:hypothetical protein
VSRASRQLPVRSRNRLAPGCPSSGGAGAGPGDEFAPAQHSVQVTVRVSLSHHAWVPAARSAPQHVHASSRRSVSFRPATERTIGSTRTILNPLAARSTDVQRPGEWQSGRPAGGTGGALSRHAGGRAPRWGLASVLWCRQGSAAGSQTWRRSRAPYVAAGESSSRDSALTVASFSDDAWRARNAHPGGVQPGFAHRRA